MLKELTPSSFKLLVVCEWLGHKKVQLKMSEQVPQPGAYHIKDSIDAQSVTLTTTMCPM